MARSGQIAANLHCSTGLRTGDRVAVLLTDVPDLVCSMLAIMRLGLVYVPLDTRNSMERLEAVVSDCRPSTILCDSSTEAQAGLLATSGTLITNIKHVDNCKLAGEKLPDILAAPDEVGFVMYTSGTTGPPKGVLLTHSGLMDQMSGITSEFGIGREVVLQSASRESDLSLDQMFISLANGGTLVTVPRSAREDAIELVNIMHGESVTHTAFASSEYLDFLKHSSRTLRKCGPWRFAFTGREKVTARLRRAMRDLELPELELVSLYGPVESSVSCSRVRLNYRDACEDFSDVAGESFCGQMMPNYSIVILDQDLRPVPVGYPGEICIAGPGLGRGYLKNPDDEARELVNNPFASPDDISEGRTRLFRSGDKGRVLEDGSVHFIGRLENDREVTIRDNRVNLDEIAEVIIREANPAIFDAAVSWRQESGMLAAFVTLADESTGNIDGFLRRLKATMPLPTHMMPGVILPIKTLPRNFNGRKDFNASDKLLLPAGVLGGVNTVFFTVGAAGEDYLGGPDLYGSNGRSEARVGLLLRGRHLSASHSSTSCVAV